MLLKDSILKHAPRNIEYLRHATQEDAAGPEREEEEDNDDDVDDDDDDDDDDARRNRSFCGVKLAPTEPSMFGVSEATLSKPVLMCHRVAF